jgi:hypothetical protein
MMVLVDTSVWSLALRRKIPIQPKDYETAARFHNTCRRNGSRFLNVMPQTTAKEHGTPGGIRSVRFLPFSFTNTAHYHAGAGKPFLLGLDRQ